MALDDTRIAQEALARIWGPRQGRVVEEMLQYALKAPNPVSRQAAIEASAAKPRSATLLAALKARAATEEDARVRDALALALAKLEDEAAAQELLGRKDRPEDMGLRLLTELRVLGASKRETALQELVTLALSHPDRSAVLLEACSLLEEKPGAPATKLIDFCLEHADGFVRASAAGLVGKHKLVDRLPQPRPAARRGLQRMRKATCARRWSRPGSSSRCREREGCACRRARGTHRAVRHERSVVHRPRRRP